MRSYPTGMPAAIKAETSFQLVDPLVSTQSDNGQTRWDRRFTSVPASTPVKWIFTDSQCQAFQAWYRDQLRDGAEWFEMPLRSPVGRRMEQCHFTRAYSGPTRLGFNRWVVTAQLLLREMPLTFPGWGEFPEFILGASIIDFALNEEWPLYNPSNLLTEDGDRLTTEDGDPLELE